MPNLRKSITSNTISRPGHQLILGKSETLDTASVLRLVAKSWPYLRELEGGTSYISEIARRLNKKPPEATGMLNELARAGLVNKQKQEGSRRIDCALTSRGRAWVRAARELETQEAPRESQLVDSEEVDFLLSVIRSPASPESLEEAEDLLLKTISTHRVSRSDAEALVSAAKKHLSHGQRDHWARWLSIIYAISKNAEEKGILQLVQQNILPHVLDLFEKPELQGSSRKVAGAIARDLMGEEKWHTTLRKLVEARAQQTPTGKDEQWSMVEDSLIDSLREMYMADRLGVLRWLFGLMKSKDEPVRQRAQQLNQRLKG